MRKFHGQFNSNEIIINEIDYFQDEHLIKAKHGFINLGFIETESRLEAKQIFLLKKDKWCYDKYKKLC